jgi:hypothetical protein
MLSDASCIVRVVSLPDATGSFIWEICREDDVVVVERSKQSFPTRLEALLDSAKAGAALALEAVQQVPLAFG